MSQDEHQRDLKTGMQHLARLLETVRSELGIQDPDHEWPGLSGRTPEGAEEAKLFAREVAGDGATGNIDTLFRLFNLRQSEIALALMSRLVDRIDELEARLAVVEGRGES